MCVCVYAIVAEGDSGMSAVGIIQWLMIQSHWQIAAVTFKQSEMCLASCILPRFAFHPSVCRGFRSKRPKVGRESDMKYPWPLLDHFHTTQSQRFMPFSGLWSILEYPQSSEPFVRFLFTQENSLPCCSHQTEDTHKAMFLSLVQAVSSSGQKHPFRFTLYITFTGSEISACTKVVVQQTCM